MGTKTGTEQVKEPSIDELKVENARLKRENEEYATLNSQLHYRLGEIGRVDELEAATELYADPANWTSEGKFAPVSTWIDVSDPYLPARRALDLYNG